MKLTNDAGAAIVAEDVEAVIVTQDVAVTAECPRCGCEVRYGIDCFDYMGLWYGEESMECPKCGLELRIVHAERG